MILETSRLVLREMLDSDYAALSKILQDETIMYAYEGAFSDAETKAWLEKQKLNYHEYGFGLWAVTLKDTGEMIGQCGLTKQEYKDQQILEVGYLFQKAFWHNGYATEAAIACKEYAVETLHEAEVFSIICDTNIPSQNVAKRNGMVVIDKFIKHYRGIDMPRYLFGIKGAEKTKTSSGLEITIRQETPKDYTQVNDLVYQAFAVDHDFSVEGYLKELRKKEVFVPELSLVVELQNGKLIGQVTLYQTDIVTESGSITELVLSPISVLPSFFGQGVGRELIGYALTRAGEMGYNAVFLQGDPGFYEKFGFEPAYKYGIYHETDPGRKAEHCMVYILKPGGLDGVSGLTDYQ